MDSTPRSSQGPHPAARALLVLLALALTAIALRELSRAPEWRALSRPGWDRDGVAAAGELLEPLRHRFAPGTRIGYLHAAGAFAAASEGAPSRRTIAAHWLAPLVLVDADSRVAACLVEAPAGIAEAELLARLPAGRDWQASERLGERYLWVTERAK